MSSFSSSFFFVDGLKLPQLFTCMRHLSGSHTPQTFSSYIMCEQYCALYFQARIMAIDRGTPPRSSFAVVTIGILRNQNGPVFDDNSITRTVYEDAPINEIIFTAVARDSDRAVCSSWSIPVDWMVDSVSISCFYLKFCTSDSKKYLCCATLFTFAFAVCCRIDLLHSLSFIVSDGYFKCIKLKF